MNIKKTFFYDQLTAKATITEEKKEKLLKFFETNTSDSAPALNLDELSNKAPIRGEVLLLSSYLVKTASNGNPFLEIKFNTSNGVITGRMFDQNGSVQSTVPLLDSHALFIVDGSVNEYNNSKSININRLKVCDKPVNATAFLPKSSLPVDEMLIELFVYLDALEEPHRTIALKGLQMYWSEFSTKPAAKGHHHAYTHGLLKHTLGLMRISNYLLEESVNPYEGILHLIRIAEEQHKQAMLKNLKEEIPQKYPYMTWSNSFDHLYQMLQLLLEMDGQPLDKSLVTTAIFYHDMGKILEYSNVGEDENKFQLLYPNLKSTGTYMKAGIDMDPLGKLMGHMMPGILLLDRTVNQHQIDVTLEDIVKYNHCILSHHGKLEWGTNVKPMIPEAVIVHLADYFDSRWEQDDTIS